MTHDAHEVAPSMPDYQDRNQVQGSRPARQSTSNTFYLLLSLITIVLLTGTGLAILGQYQAAAVFVTVVTAAAGLATALAALCRAAGS